MLAVFVIWGLDTEGDAENPVLNLCWERFKRVGEFLNLLIMKNLSFDAFTPFAMTNAQSSQIVGGTLRCEWKDSGAGMDCGSGGGTCKINQYKSGKRCFSCGGSEGACRNDLVAQPGSPVSEASFSFD
jgi:hypothetical protein